MLLVQLQPRLLDIEQEFVITAVEAMECLLANSFLKTNKIVFNLREKELYSSHCKVLIPLHRKNARCSIFCNSGRKHLYTE